MILPVALAVPPVAKLPPVTVAVAEIIPNEITFPALTLPKILAKPPVSKLPPVIVAAADINPSVVRFPPLTLPTAVTTPLLKTFFAFTQVFVLPICAILAFEVIAPSALITPVVNKPNAPGTVLLSPISTVTLPFAPT